MKFDLFKIFKVVLGDFGFPLKLKMFMYYLGLLIASTAGYTMTVINKLDFYAVSPLKHARKSDVPAPQLPIV